MRVGIFARTFPGPSVEEILDQVAAHGIPDVQFNMSCAGVPTLPDAVEPELGSVHGNLHPGTEREPDRSGKSRSRRSAK